MVNAVVLKVKLAEGQMAPRWFVSSFVSGCHRSAGCGLQAMAYGLWDIGRWPWAVKRSWVSRYRLSNGFSKVCSLLFIGYVWIQVRSLVDVVRVGWWGASSDYKASEYVDEWQKRNKERARSPQEGHFYTVG